MPANIWNDVDKLRYLAAGLVFAVAFILYCCTMAPTVTLVDSGELILAGANLGVAHPPGFPLYLMLAHLASLVPIGNMAVRIHAASALFGALASGVMTLLVAELMLMPTLQASAKKKKKKEKQDSAAETVEPRPAAFVIVPAAIAGLLFAFSRTLWEYATIAEVYTLNSLLIVTILWLMFAWRREYRGDEPSYRKLYIAAVVFGLAMGVHHVTTAFFLPSLAILVYTSAGRQFFTSRRFLFAALIAIGGLVIVYSYLPFAASRSPMMNWGEPATLDAVWRHVTGQQYRVFFSVQPDRLLDLAKFLLREWSFVWLPATLALAVAGLVDRFRRDRRTFTFLAIVVLIDVVYCVVYPISEDRDAYYFPTFIALAISAAYGARWIIGMAKGWTDTPLTPSRAAAALFVLPIIGFAANLPYNNRHNFYVGHDYVDNIYASIERGGMVLTSDWQSYSPSFYVRDIEGQRKDVVYIDINLLRRSWYFGYLEKAFPETMARSRDKVRAYLEELRAWDRDPAAYERSQTLNQRINSRYQEMVISLLTEHLKTAPLYVTSELADPNNQKDLGLVKMLQDKYQLVPQGLVFRFVDKGSTAFIAPPEIKTRGLNDGTMRYDDEDVVRRLLIPAYAQMLSNTGLYLLSQDMNEQALGYFQQSLSVDPTYEPAKKALAAILNVQGPVR